MKNGTHIKETFKHAIIYSSAGILQKAVGFIMIPFYAHYLHAEGYGIISMIEVASSVLAAVVGYGISSAMTRFYFIKETEEERKDLISTALIVMFFLVFTTCIPALLLNKQISSIIFGRNGLENFIIIGILSFMADMTTENGQQYILIKKWSILFSTLSVLRFFLGLLLNIYFIAVLKLGVVGVLYSNLITASLLCCTIHSIAFKSVGLRFKKKIAKELISYALPLIPGYIAMFARNNADKFVIRTFLGLSQVGVYSMVLKFSSLLGILIFGPFMKIWSVKRMEISDYEEGPEIISKMYTYLLSLMLFAGLLLALEIPLILKLLAPPDFWVPSIFALFAVLTNIAFSSYYQFTFGLLYAKVTYKISIINITAACVSVLLNFSLTKYFGLGGAFVAMLLVYTIQCILAYLMAKRYYRIPFEWVQIFKILFSTIALFLLIDNFSLAKFGMETWLEQTFLPPTITLISFLNIDHFKEGKFLLIFSHKFSVIADAFARGVLSLSFIISLFIFRIIKVEQVKSVIRNYFLPKIKNL